MGSTREKLSGGRTIEVNEAELRAYLENVAETPAMDAVVVPNEGPRGTAPPPLPKRKLAPVVLIGIGVIAVCAALGIGAGYLLGTFGSRPEAAPPTPAAGPDPAEQATAIVPLDEIVVEAAPDAGP
jgi:hypothetical protein